MHNINSSNNNEAKILKKFLLLHFAVRRPLRASPHLSMRNRIICNKSERDGVLAFRFSSNNSHRSAMNRLHFTYRHPNDADDGWRLPHMFERNQLVLFDTDGRMAPSTTKRWWLRSARKRVVLDQPRPFP